MAQGLSDHAYPIGGVYERYSRLVPNESQVNQFMRAMPKKIKRNLSYILLEMQLKEALRLGIIDKFIEVYLDDHHEYYYGSDRSTNNPTIIGTWLIAKSKMPYVTDPYYDSVNTLSWMVSFCAPFFYANNSFAGVIGTDLNLQAIQSYVASYQVGRQALL